MSGQVRGYLGMSLDGKIAGPDDELDWLTAPPRRLTEDPVPSTKDEWVSFDGFTSQVGVMLMGRRTFDVVIAFEDWFYGDLKVLVATNRPLPSSIPATVEAISGDITELVSEATSQSGELDVYLDGGQLVSAALDAGLLDELITTVLPTVRGQGISLFSNLQGPQDLDLTKVATDATGMVQLTWVPHS
ncbi:MAG: dihydrofolate reductase family protein [Solirubrobacterales bacterium]